MSDWVIPQVKHSSVIDPLTRTLMGYEDEEDLNARIDLIYDKLDENGDGKLAGAGLPEILSPTPNTLRPKP